MPDPTVIDIAFLLFPNVTQLDLTGPAQVLSRIPGARIHLVARDREPVPTDSGFSLLPTASFAEMTAPAILCVPGGFGDQAAMEDEAVLEWLRRAGEGAEWVTSVCTGALILGAAGLIDGYRATTHWASHHHLAGFGAIPVRERVVRDRNRVTGGGVTAGIDFALTLAAAIQDEALARLIQLSLEYDPAPPFASGSPEAAGEAIVAHYRALAARWAPDREERRRAAVDRYREARASAAS